MMLYGWCEACEHAITNYEFAGKLWCSEKCRKQLKDSR